MYYAEIVLMCFLFVITSLDCKFVDVSRKDNVAKCIRRITKTTESIITDLTVVNFKESSEFAFLFTKPVTFVSRAFLWPGNTFPNKFYVIHCADYQEFQSGIQQLRNDFFWNPRGHFIIIIEQLDGHIRLVSGLLLKLNVFNVTVVTPSESGTDYEIYAFNPQLDVCGKPAIKTLQFFTQCSELNPTDNLYQYKTPQTLKGCHVKVVAHSYWPFISFNKTLGSGTTQIRLALWAEAEGINVEYVRNNMTDDFFGTILENFTFTGMLSEIDSGDAHVAAGGLILLYPRARALDYSYPYNLDYNWVVVTRAPLINNWPAVMRQFGLTTVIVIFLLIAFFCIAIVHFSVFQKKKKDAIRDVFIVFGYVCGNNSVHPGTIRDRSSLRIFVCCMLFFVFFLSYKIQAFILSATTNPIREYQINHLDEAIKTCKPLKSLMWLRSYNINDTPECYTIVGCLNELKERRMEKHYTVIADTEFQVFSLQFLDSKGEPELIRMLEPLSLILRTIYFTRGSSLYPSYATYSRRIRSGGLLEKRSEDILFTSKLTVRRFDVVSSEWLHQFREVFCVLLVGYSLATIAFIYECKSYLKKIKCPIGKKTNIRK